MPLTLSRFVRDAVSRLEKCYSGDEARSIVLGLCGDFLGTERFEHVINPDYTISVENEARLEAAMRRLENMEPLQYVAGKAYFYGMELYVDKAVLIPRQETEELCRLALDSFPSSGNRSHGAGDLPGSGLRILDVCTGSGCIAWAMSANLPGAAVFGFLDVCTGSGCIAWAMSANLPGAAVFGCDISYPALEVASSQKTGARCPVFFQNDILSGDFPVTGDFDAILSNPPYVTSSEKRLMSRNVLDYEPHSALFVTDEDPLVFYRALAGMASAHLKPEGFGIVEINEAFGDGCRGLFMDYGFSNSVIIKDLNGKDRFCRFSR